MSKLAFDDVALDVTSNDHGYTILLGGHPYRVELTGSASGGLELMVDGQRALAFVTSDGQRRWVSVHGRTFVLTKTSTAARHAADHDGSSQLTAPMPGQVRAVNAQAGDRVTRGQMLVVLEAMKMEIRLQAPFDGTVSSLDAAVGQTVEREQVLVRIQKS